MNLWHGLFKRRLAISLLTFIIVISSHSVAMGQFTFLHSSSQNQIQTTPWWDISKAERCGKLFCSEVAFPYFPYGNLFDDLTLAIEPKLEEDLTQVTSKIEKRAAIVEETMLAIFKQTVKTHLSWELLNHTGKHLNFLPVTRS